MSTPVISIIIPTKDRGDIFYLSLKLVIDAVKNIDAEIIIVNDSKTQEIISDLRYKNIRAINNPKSGVASARNLGAGIAKSNMLLFIDDDMLISEYSISEALILHDKLPRACINFNWIYPENLINEIKQLQFGRYLIDNGFTSLKGWFNNDSWKDDELFEAYGITSQFLLIPKNIFAEVNGYDETFPHAGAEDTEFGKRLKKHGVKFYISPQTLVYHNEEDRVEIRPWLERKKRGGETRKVASDMGHHEVGLTNSKFKRNIILNLYHLKFLFYFTLRLIPNYLFFDPLYFRIVNVLCSIYIHHGFYSNKK